MKFREVGTGKSKKIAKRQAAQKMWERLQNQTLDQTEVIQACIDDANDEVMTRDFSKFKKKRKRKKNMMGLEWSFLKTKH